MFAREDELYGNIRSKKNPIYTIGFINFKLNEGIIFSRIINISVIDVYFIKFQIWPLAKNIIQLHFELDNDIYSLNLKYLC